MMFMLWLFLQLDNNKLLYGYIMVFYQKLKHSKFPFVSLSQWHLLQCLLGDITKQLKPIHHFTNVNFCSPQSSVGALMGELIRQNVTEQHYFVHSEV